MDKANIIQIVVGFAITAWLTTVNESVTDGKHERDIMNENIQTNAENILRDREKSEAVDSKTWEYIDEDLRWKIGEAEQDATYYKQDAEYWRRKYEEK